MIPFPDKKYNIIYADPPWPYSSKELYGDKINGHKNGKRKRFADIKRIYKTMSIKDICNLSVKDIIEKDCACFLWVTDSHLKEGMRVLESWGFKYKTIAFNWIKYYSTSNMVFNFAPWTLKSWEICLLGIKGKMSKYKVSNNIKGILQETRTQHSKKPTEARRRIVELFGDLPRIELFARPPKDLLFEDESYKGWDVWGNECI